MNRSTAVIRSDHGRTLTSVKVLLPRLAADLKDSPDFTAPCHNIGAGKDIIIEGKPCTHLFLFIEGAAIRYRILRSGQRVIFNILIPGDFAGLTSCRFAAAPFSVKTLMPSAVHRIPLSWVSHLCENNPQLAARLFWSSAVETAMLAEHMIAVGRRQAPERMAHFLLELLVRLRQRGLADENMFWFPLTQEIIADALSLSVPYVNRILQQLRDDDLIEIKNKWIFIRNIEELSALADFDHDYLQPRAVADIRASAFSQ